MEALQEFVDSFTYLGFFRAPARQFESANPRGNALSGDMVRYWVGRHCGEQVLNWRLVRLVLSPARDPWLNAAYRRHALKTVATAACHGTPRRGQRSVGVRVGVLLHGSDPSRHGRCAQDRALARPGRPPGAWGGGGRRHVAMASSRREGAHGSGARRETFADAVSARTGARSPGRRPSE